MFIIIGIMLTGMLLGFLLHNKLGLEALIITLAAVTGSILCAWGLWYLLYIRNKGKETEV